MAAPNAAIASNEQTHVQTWNGSVSFEGLSMIKVLEELAGIYFAKKSEKLDELPQVKWQWKYPAAVVKNRELESLEPALFKQLPLQKLVDQKEVVGIACDIPSLGKVAVFIVRKNFFECARQHCKDEKYRFHVKNYIDCEEAHRIKELLEMHRNPSKRP